MIRKFVVIALVLLGPLLAGPVWAAAPTETVQRLQDALLASMKGGKKLGFSGRYDALAPVIEETFNLPLMARYVSGSYWARLSPSQQDELVKAFTKMTVATYAGRFDGYDGERFEILGEKEGGRRSVVVTAQIVKSDGEPVPLSYVLRSYDGKWRIVDVHLESTYSELATKRAEYTSVLGREGFDALIKRLDSVVANYAAKS